MSGLPELDFDHQLFAAKQQEGDSKLFVVFYNHFIADDAKTSEEGRPIYKDCVFIRIITPGDRNNIIERPVRPDDKARFPKQWLVFEQGEKEVGEGTRLEEWPMISRSMLEELKYFGFRTVEHLANAKDEVCSRTSVPRVRQGA
jgi:hypothetical protein